jgi:hypothetical protein
MMIHSELELAHQTRWNCIISGPPGIGKTTAIEKWRFPYGDQTLLITVPEPNRGKGHSPAQAMLLILEAIYGKYSCSIPRTSDSIILRNAAEHAIDRAFREQGYHRADWRFTIVFDEAQGLSESALNALRHWWDNADQFFPEKVVFVFVGNDEFSMKVNSKGKSIISNALKSRSLHPLTLTRADLSLEEVEAFIRAKGIEEKAVIREFVDYVKGNDDRRDFRTLTQLLDRCRTYTSGGPVTSDIARRALKRR